MKKSNLVLMALASILFFSCQKEFTGTDLKTISNATANPKINTWVLSGTALSEDTAEPISLNEEWAGSWAITYPLSVGDLRFKGNNNNTLEYGHNTAEKEGMLSCNGASIHIGERGNYTIRVGLTNTGTYTYSIEKVVIP